MRNDAKTACGVRVKTGLAAACMMIASGAMAVDVVKDHVSESTLWSGTEPVSNLDDTGSTADFILASAFTGNGTLLRQVEGIFWNADSTNVANAIDWSQVDFLITFYDDAAAFQADPRNGSQQFLVDVPDNVDWMTPVATYSDPSFFGGQSFDLLHLVFDVESLGISTTSGQEQLVAITPTCNELTVGLTGMMFSTGGAGAVGLELDRFVNYQIIPQFGPDTLQALGAPYDYAAYRVVLGDVPCPGNTDADSMIGVVDLLALLGSWGPCPAPCASDFNGDEMVSVVDLLDLLAAWGPCP